MMQWYNEPPSWQADGSSLTVTTQPTSDFWRKTHYGFIRDSGHFYFQEFLGNFEVEVVVRGEYVTLYDQAGLMVRVDEENWLKCGIEYVDGIQYASAVVTREYSDWSVAPLPMAPASIKLKVIRAGQSLEISVAPDDGDYQLLRVTYLPMQESVAIGPMCASPGEAGFTVHFAGFRILPTPAVSGAG